MSLFNKNKRSRSNSAYNPGRAYTYEELLFSDLPNNPNHPVLATSPPNTIREMPALEVGMFNTSLRAGLWSALAGYDEIIGRVPAVAIDRAQDKVFDGESDDILAGDGDTRVADTFDGQYNNRSSVDEDTLFPGEHFELWVDQVAEGDAGDADDGLVQGSPPANYHYPEEYDDEEHQNQASDEEDHDGSNDKDKVTSTNNDNSDGEAANSDSEQEPSADDGEDTAGSSTLFIEASEDDQEVEGDENVEEAECPSLSHVTVSSTSDYYDAPPAKRARPSNRPQGTLMVAPQPVLPQPTQPDQPGPSHLPTTSTSNNTRIGPRGKMQRQCPHCFAFFESLPRHVNSVHLKQRPHACGTCGGAFSEKNKMRNHESKCQLSAGTKRKAVSVKNVIETKGKGRATMADEDEDEEGAGEEQEEESTGEDYEGGHQEDEGDNDLDEHGGAAGGTGGMDGQGVAQLVAV